ncbi:type II toxin-antitoxin system RelB/DinJ family antitoxin [Streptococcus uberis]|nr:type II toxin-antitoxin system RelB/DinJ family antitoxin [Streptococcus uberis]MCK1202226.1 type II toxin-antitoxin system RelB/DinJ family antitoxin [Streptococcus uberis]
MTMETIEIELDDDLLKETEKVLENLNIDVSEAIVMFLKECIEVNGLPFNIDEEEQN